MMTEDDIHGSKTLNKELLIYATEDVNKRLADINSSRKSIDSRAATLLAGYVAMFGFLASRPQLFTTLWIASLGILSVGAGLLMLSLRPFSAGWFGSSPEQWLRNGVTNSEGETEFIKMMAYLLRFKKDELDTAIKGYIAKRRFFELGLYSGVISLTVCVLAILY